MFAGKKYRIFGFQQSSIGFSDTPREDLDTCKYGGVIWIGSNEMNAPERRVMVRRVLAVLNVTSGWTIEKLETTAPVPGEDPQYYGDFCGRQYRRLPGPLKSIVGFDGRCPLHGIFGKSGGFAHVGYADEISRDEQDFMARRLTAAMNLTRYYRLADLEAIEEYK